MNQYENFEAVRDAFASGEFEMPEEIEVDRIKYHVVGGTVGMRIDEMYRKGMKHMLVYSLSSENRQLA